MLKLMRHLGRTAPNNQGRALRKAAREMLACNLIPEAIAMRSHLLAGFVPRKDMPDPWLEAASALVPPVCKTDTSVKGEFVTGFSISAHGCRHLACIHEDDGNDYDVWDVCARTGTTPALALASAAVLAHMMNRDGCSAWVLHDQGRTTVG